MKNHEGKITQNSAKFEEFQTLKIGCAHHDKQDNLKLWRKDGQKSGRKARQNSKGIRIFEHEQVGSDRVNPEGVLQIEIQPSGKEQGISDNKQERGLN